MKWDTSPLLEQGVRQGDEVLDEHLEVLVQI